jgi:uncharacterized protein YjiS (DUF1127 family)
MGATALRGYLRERKARLKAYRATRQQLEQLTDADLADIGAKRYQLGHIARAKALK